MIPASAVCAKGEFERHEVMCDAWTEKEEVGVDYWEECFVSSCLLFLEAEAAESHGLLTFLFGERGGIG